MATANDRHQGRRVRLLTWNILHGGGRRMPRIALELLEIDADLIALCEYRPGIMGGQLRGVLADHGWVHQHDTSGDGPDAGRRNALLIAARTPLRPVGTPLSGPHAALARKLATVELPEFDLAVTVAHVPDARLGDARAEARKSAAWHAVLAEASARRGLAHAVLGDLNTGRHRVDERGSTFSCTALLGRLRTLGYRDAWADRSDAEPSRGRAFSWVSHAGAGFRLDHAWCSEALSGSVSGAEYLHGPRLRGLSDHAALVVELKNC